MIRLASFLLASAMALTAQTGAHSSPGRTLAISEPRPAPTGVAR